MFLNQLSSAPKWSAAPSRTPPVPWNRLEVIEFCLSTENEYVGIGARHTENLVHEIWRKKCIASAAIKGSDPAL